MATISGTLRDSSGNPVPDATVSALDQEALAAQDTTGSDGAFRLTQLAQGRTFILRVMVGDAFRTVGEVLVDGESVTRDIDLADETTTVTSSTSVTVAPSDTTTTTAPTDTTTTTTSDTTTSSATSDTTTSSATSDTSTSSTATSDTSTSSTATSDTSTSSTVSSDTTTSSATSATSATTVAPSVTLAPDPAFAALSTLINDPVFAITPPVNIEEARQARNLFTVGFYLRAGVPQAIANLNSILAGSNGARINLLNKTDLLARHSAAIKALLDARNENTYTEAEVLVQVRKQFNQGLESAEDINRDFPTIYRGLVNMVADDLMGVTPQQLDSGVVFDATQRERLFNFLRRLKASIIALTESLSFAGSLGTIVPVNKWSTILRDALTIIQTVGQSHVASDNVDEKHWASVLSALISRTVAENRPYLVHSREGGQLLSDVIKVYELITQQDGLEKEDESFIRGLFYTPGNVPDFGSQSVAERLKANGRLLRDNWPANFGA